MRYHVISVVGLSSRPKPDEWLRQALEVMGYTVIFVGGGIEPQQVRLN